MASEQALPPVSGPDAHNYYPTSTQFSKVLALVLWAKFSNFALLTGDLSFLVTLL